MKKTGNQELVSRLLKTYSVLSQATDEIILEKGTPMCDKGGWACTPNGVYEIYKKHLRNSKDCGKNAGCFKQYDNGFKLLNGTIDTHDLNTIDYGFRKLILSDGTQIMFLGNSDTIIMRVDINGEKLPNQLGRDLFQFQIKDDGLYPQGCDNDSSDCKTSSNGWNCACKVITEGEMNY